MKKSLKLLSILIPLILGITTHAQNSLKIGDVTYFPLSNTVSASLELSTGFELSFLRFELGFEPRHLQLDSANITMESARFEPEADTTVSIDNKVGTLAISVSEETLGSGDDPNFVGSSVITSGNGKIFTLEFSTGTEIDCERSTFTLNSVEAFDTKLESVDLAVGIHGSEVKEFEMNNPSRGCLATDKRFYSCTDEIRVELEDGNLGGSVPCVDVVVDDGSEDSERVCLEEVSSESGIFEGLISISNSTAASSGDSILSADNESVINLQYEDADDGSGSGVTISKTATVDCEPPVISLTTAELNHSIGNSPPDLSSLMSVLDNSNEDLNERIEIDSGDFDPSIPGTYTLIYSVVDDAGNIAIEKVLIIHVVDDSIRILINGKIGDNSSTLR